MITTEFMVTFGSQYNDHGPGHPTWRPIHRDGYVIIEADDPVQARETALRFFNTAWSDLRPFDALDAAKYYPRGEIGRIPQGGSLHRTPPRTGPTITKLNAYLTAHANAGTREAAAVLPGPGHNDLTVQDLRILADLLCLQTDLLRGAMR